MKRHTQQRRGDEAGVERRKRKIWRVWMRCEVMEDGLERRRGEVMKKEESGEEKRIIFGGKSGTDETRGERDKGTPERRRERSEGESEGDTVL